MSRRWQIFIGIGLILAAVLLLIYFLTRPSLTATAVDLPLEATYAKYDDNSVVFSNGRSFITYNYTTKASQAISPDGLLPSTIRELYVSDNRQYLLFRTAEQRTNDTLGQQLIAQKESPDQGRWWVYDISAKKFTVFSISTLAAQFEGNTVVALSSALIEDVGTVGKIATYNLPELKVTKTVQTKFFVDLFVANNTWYTQTNKRAIEKVNRQDGSSSEIAEEISGFKPASNKPLAITKTINAKSELLQTLDTDSGDARKLSEIEGEDMNAIWTDDNTNIVFSVGGQGLKKIGATKGRASAIRVKGTTDEASVRPLLGFGVDSFMLKNDDYAYFTGKSAQKNVFLPGQGYKKKLSDNTLIEYFTNERAFIVSVIGTATPQVKASVYAQLKADGINPDLVSIRFTETSLRS